MLQDHRWWNCWCGNFTISETPQSSDLFERRYLFYKIHHFVVILNSYGVDFFFRILFALLLFVFANFVICLWFNLVMLDEHCPPGVSWKPTEFHPRNDARLGPQIIQRQDSKSGWISQRTKTEKVDIFLNLEGNILQFRDFALRPISCLSRFPFWAVGCGCSFIASWAQFVGQHGQAACDPESTHGNA